MSLNCVYCKKPVFGTSGVTVPGSGPAHQHCYQAQAALARTFQALDISQLTDDELLDLQDMVLAEVNDRRRRDEGGGDSEIELF
ncbi:MULTISPECIES: DUF2175 domain-containing protein [Thalassolituus]|jgi:hypothetical protein|uniref:DUF2175 domain-containing protein n=1 Tax=Thalassolituus maritimus TaxID=484498 RepID=A0A1N7MBQ4_9GAMM|nr:MULTISPECIES: DUF2175 domain-containing protein [Thalassolituus]MAG44242.1 DUF2175 domain-containing protein [Oceanospirillaceae bacterium]MAX86046.1 DUF2175 domain-containing protein [Oceanospirillaceae bacterium]TPD54661.1 MAG: DUF2175 domain-containing protein [Thalassolituus maritimus]SIS83477.1 hypothetical protein SAMN05421686_10581 [Thalassolituus maritimus]|tara:strand:- start:167 stop:418 length:252 start_codon:yes stop_codon:yes gene_type:complete